MTALVERVPVGDAVQLWLCRTDQLDLSGVFDLGRQWLDERESEHANRFLFHDDRRQYLVSHALMRRTLRLHTGIAEPELRFWRSYRGRLYLEPPAGGWPYGDEDIDFNLSHTDGVSVVAVVTRRRVGVDVERMDRQQGATIDRVAESFTEGEQAWLAGLASRPARREAVLRVWTLKEAYAKARGLGLALPFDSFAFEFDARGDLVAFHPPPDDEDGRWQFAELQPFGMSQLAVAVEVIDTEVAELHVRHGFPWEPEQPRVHRLRVPAKLPGGED